MKNRRVYFYTKHENKGASSRYRSIQYFPMLRESGFEVIQRYLFSDAYLESKYKKNKIYLIYAIAAYLRRLLHILMDFRSSNVIYVEKEFFPYLPPFFEFLAKVIRLKYIVDYDDAVWHNYDSNRFRFIRYLLSNKHKKIIGYAEKVVVGNDYLAQYALKFHPKKKVTIIPTALSSNRYASDKLSRADNATDIVWIGSPSTSKYIIEIDSELKKITDRYNVVVRLIGFDSYLADQLSCKNLVIEWNEFTELTELSKGCLGIMPLVDRPFERGKCGFKLIQYMALGLPILGSPIGVNDSIIIDNVNGYKCSTASDWSEKIEYLILNPELRQTLGERGRKIFINEYCAETLVHKYIELINEAFIDKNKSVGE